jgi:hypothetical protein
MEFISQHVPWLPPLSAWLVAILAVLALLSIPAYFVLYPISTNVRRGISSFLARFCTRQASAREDRRRSAAALVEELRSDSGISYLAERNNRLEAALGSLTMSISSVKSQLNRILDLPMSLERIANRFPTTQDMGVVFPDVPSSDQIANQRGSLRIAKVRLVVSTLILIALISVNTGMLGQILRELGFIPHDLAYAGIPLYLVFALLLTVAEAGLGYVHTAGRPGPDDPPGVAIWPVFAVGLAFVIAGVEGFFYSQVAPRGEALVNLPIGFPIKQETLFFLWGAGLVLILFMLGMIWSTSLERIARSRDDFPALVRQFSEQREKFAAASESIARNAGRLKEHSEGVREVVRSLAPEITSIVTTASQARNDIAATESADRRLPRELSAAEAYQFIYMSGIWFTLTFLGIVLITMSCLYALGFTFPRLQGTAATAIAAGVGAAFVILGMLLPRGELLLDGSGTRKLIVSGSLWRGRIAIVLTILIVLAFTALFWRVWAIRYQAALWLIILLVGGCLAAAASQSAATAKGLRPWLLLCGNFLLRVVEALARLFVRVLLAVAYVIEVISLGFAAPIFVFRGRELPSFHSSEKNDNRRLAVTTAS